MRSMLCVARLRCPYVFPTGLTLMLAAQACGGHTVAVARGGARGSAAGGRWS